jgi:hypothetical protein
LPELNNWVLLSYTWFDISNGFVACVWACEEFFLPPLPFLPGVETDSFEPGVFGLDSTSSLNGLKGSFTSEIFWKGLATSGMNGFF